MHWIIIYAESIFDVKKNLSGVGLEPGTIW